MCIGLVVLGRKFIQRRKRFGHCCFVVAVDGPQRRDDRDDSEPVASVVFCFESLSLTARWRSACLVERWSGGAVERWSGGVVEWWSGGVVEWWSGGVVEWWSGVCGSILHLSISPSCHHARSSFSTPVLSPWRSALMPTPLSSVSQRLLSGIFDSGMTMCWPSLMRAPPPVTIVGQLSR
jgi:hypothetical protein